MHPALNPFVTIVLFVAMTSSPIVSWLATCNAAEPTCSQSDFGVLPSGEQIKKFVLKNSSGTSVSVVEYGATVTELRTADRNGNFANIVLGPDSLDALLKGFPAASVIGRYANRIRGAQFTLDNQTHQVTKNAGPNHIHGGNKNFAAVRWSGRCSADADSAQVTLEYVSPDGEEGFPGEVKVTVEYVLTNANELRIRYTAVTNKPTVINLTNHAYFNLKGQGDVLDHELQVSADNYTIADKQLIPTGKTESVAGTPLDFRQSHQIGERIAELANSTNGYDHNYIINGSAGEMRVAARVTEPTLGRVLECHTTEPGMQLYTANHFGGNPFPKHGAFCLETQHYPDSPNRPEFPSTVLRPGSTFHSETIFRFSVLK